MGAADTTITEGAAMGYLTHRYRHPRLVRAVGVLLLGALALIIDRALQPDNFPVQRVSFEGEFHWVTPQELEQAVHETVKGNFFALDLDKVETAAKAVPWVSRVSVRREWPRAIHIQYSEHQLVARWSGRGWLNSSGAVVDLPEHQAVAGLPHLAGPKGSQKTVLAVYRRLAPVTASVGLTLKALRLTERRSWIAEVAEGGEATGQPAATLVLRLGKREMETRLARFVQVYPQVLANKVAHIQQVDLRYPNGFTVAWSQPSPTDRMIDREKGVD